ncbi:AAA family ATPase [Persicobacter psychrovividus]|uniref:UvrD-like helicase C-terminal domain-containing protein n=1 Tax=Persicobacter psychrovividus TaxID=387638 RepID=A0ABN6LG49_9BACT|nr:hypothetical protein PEPS_43570 [Persicobacter psychrovividus]
MFLIPYNKLSEEQKSVIRRISRQDSNLFVQGPPGSGKTLISLYTLKEMIEERAIRPLLLMYNHSLYGYLSKAMEELEVTDNVTIATKDKLFWDVSRDLGFRPQQWEEVYDAVKRRKVKKRRPYDKVYMDILNFLKDESLPKYDFAVIDEVQDVSLEEWNLLKRMTTKVISLGDFDQGVYDTNLQEWHITQNANKESLTAIFRFHKHIAELAEPFSRSKDSLVSKVTREESAVPMLYDVHSSEEADKIAEILRSLRATRERVGILCPDRGLLVEMEKSLSDRGVNAKFYAKNNELREHDFTSNEPLLLTSFSAKGLEFEHVIMFGFNNDSAKVSEFAREQYLNDIIYVTITRTNKNLYVIRNEKTVSAIKNMKVSQSNQSPELSIDDLF